jgi:4a-hydroxytetrahydrobiopterin dehydratase
MEKPLNPQQIAVYLAQVDNWKVIDNRKIQKVFEFKDFKEAMKFLNNVAKIAEKEQHHPDIYLFYNRVNLELYTHAIDGLSENDFIMAAKIDKLK